MSGTDTQDQGPPEVSRRTLIKTAAGAGVAAAVAGGAGVAAATDHADAADHVDTAGRAERAGTDHPQATGALVAHVTDLRGGTVEVFSDDARTRVTDHDLAARIARAAQK